MAHNTIFWSGAITVKSVDVLDSWMPLRHWIILFLFVMNAGWMLSDGARALILGDFFTPASGEYAGQLGPWSQLVQAIGIDPRSSLMKTIFLVYGSVSLIIALLFALRIPRARLAMILVAILGLWYLPFGTVTNVIVLTILLFFP